MLRQRLRHRQVQARGLQHDGWGPADNGFGIQVIFFALPLVEANSLRRHLAIRRQVVEQVLESSINIVLWLPLKQCLNSVLAGIRTLYVDERFVASSRLEDRVP